MEFDFISILTVAYGVTGFVALVGYVPQFMAFLRNPLLCQEAPLTTWVLWMIQTATFHLYALFVNGDKMFILMTAAFMLATFACLVVQLIGRRIARRQGLHGRRAPR